MKIYKTLQRALLIYTAVTFFSLPLLYLYPRKMPVFNYTITRFTMDAINNKKIVFLQYLYFFFSPSLQYLSKIYYSH